MGNILEKISIVFYKKQYKKNWDDFCDKEKDAWFWHTTGRIEHVVLSSGKLVNNQSFFILHNSKVIAVAPFVIRVDENTVRVADYLGWGTPSPVISRDVSRENRKKIKQVIFNEIDRISMSNKVDKIIFSRFFQILNAKDYYYYYNDMIEIGYMGAIIYTSIIDLSMDEYSIISRLRKNHNRDVKKYSDLIVCSFYKNDQICHDDVNLFKDFYFNIAKKHTHPDKIFDIFYKMIRDNKAILVKATIDNYTAGYILLITYKNQAYYLMGAQRDDAIPVIKIILYESILYLKNLNFRSFEIGRMEYENSLFLSTNDKRVGISSFKKGFGGDIYPIHQGIKYYNSEALNIDIASLISQKI